MVPLPQGAGSQAGANRLLCDPKGPRGLEAREKAPAPLAEWEAFR